MLQFGSVFTHFHLPHKASGSAQEQSLKQLPSLPDFLKHVMKLTGLRKEDVYCDLRVPEQLQTAKDDISMVLLTGHGIYCMDVKPWSGTVCAHNQNWHVQLKDRDLNFTNTLIEQVEDPLNAVTRKTAQLCSHLKRSGVPVRSSLFFPRVIFLSPDCELSEELMKKRELVSHGQIDSFLRTFKENYMGWISDVLTPSWISGHLSYRQMESVRGILGKMGTWDLLLLHGGEQLKGDYQGCQYIALDRQDTETLEFSRVKTLSAESLWALLGHVPQDTTGPSVEKEAPEWRNSRETVLRINTFLFEIYKGLRIKTSEKCE